MAAVVLGVCMAGFNALIVQIPGDDSLFLCTKPLSESLKMLSTATLFLIYHNKQTSESNTKLNQNPGFVARHIKQHFGYNLCLLLGY